MGLEPQGGGGLPVGACRGWAGVLMRFRSKQVARAFVQTPGLSQPPPKPHGGTLAVGLECAVAHVARDGWHGALVGQQFS